MTIAHRDALQRARQQLARLAAEERDYLASTPYRLAHEHDMRGARYLVRIHVVSAVPADAARLAGDVARELRASLDALASALAGAPSKFPIFESLVLFAQRARKPIARMSDEAQATLEELQPYHTIGGYRNGLLYTLRELAALDVAPLAPGVRDGATMGVNTQRNVSIVGDPVIGSGPISDGTTIATVTTKIAGPDPKLDMFLRVEYELAYANESPGRGRGAVALLGELCDHVEHTVFQALEPSLPTS